MNEQKDRKWQQPLILILCLLTLNLFIFLPSLKGDFIYDDNSLIKTNVQIQNPKFLRSVFLSPFGGESWLDEDSKKHAGSMAFYRPITSLSYWLDYKIWGLNPAGFHLTNLLIQVLNVAIFFLLLLKFNYSMWASFFSVVLFSVFPFHFENVSWISGRTDLISFLFALFSVLFFVKYIEEKRVMFNILSAGCYLLSLLSKENTVLLIFIYLFVLIKKKEAFTKLLRSMSPFLLSLGFWIILRYVALESIIMEPSGRTLMDGFAIIGFYCLKTIIPFNLSVTVNTSLVFPNPVYQIFGFAVCILFLSSLFFILNRRVDFSHPWFFLFSFTIMLIPSIVAIFSISTFSFIAWRFLYAPSAIFTTFVATFVFRKIKIVPISIFLVLVLTSIYSVEIYGKNRLYGKQASGFWLGLKHIRKESLSVQYNAGLYWLKEDEQKGLKIFNEVLKQKNHPFFSIYRGKILESLGVYYTGMRQFSKAGKYFKQALKHRDSITQSLLFHYAYFLAASEKVNQGEAIVINMLDSFPRNHRVLIHAARFYLIVKEYKKAKRLLELDDRLFPNREAKALLKDIRNRMKGLE